MSNKLLQEWVRTIPPLSILLMFLVTVKTKVVIHTPSHVGKWSIIDQYGFPWSYTQYSMASSIQYDFYVIPLLANFLFYLFILSAIFYFFNKKAKRINILLKSAVWIGCIFVSITAFILASIGHTYPHSPWYVKKIISRSLHIGIPLEDAKSYIEMPIYTNP